MITSTAHGRNSVPELLRVQSIMSTYYVANAGSNSNTGLSPTAGANGPFATFAHAASVVITGDSILLNGGDTFTESVTISVALASISSYGTGLATVISTAATNTTIVCTVPPTSVTNLNIQGTTSAFPNSGGIGLEIVTSGATVYAGCTISGCNFSNIPKGGLVFLHTSTDSGGVTGLTISNNTFNEIGAVALELTNGVAPLGSVFNYSGVSINNNTISNVLGNTASSGTAWGWGVVLQFVNIGAGRFRLPRQRDPRYWRQRKRRARRRRRRRSSARDARGSRFTTMWRTTCSTRLRHRATVARDSTSI